MKRIFSRPGWGRAGSAMRAGKTKRGRTSHGEVRPRFTRAAEPTQINSSHRVRCEWSLVAAGAAGAAAAAHRRGAHAVVRDRPLHRRRDEDGGVVDPLAAAAGAAAVATAAGIDLVAVVLVV